MKKLLCGAAMTAAAISLCPAQNSVNIVGYVNQSVPAGGYAMLANPLNATNNNINTVLPLPHDGSYDGANVFRFNRATQGYRETMSFVSGPGWLAATADDMILNPGEGFFIQNVAGVALDLSFLGEVPTGSPTQTIVGGNGYSLTASMVPWSGTLTFLGFPADDGDSVFIFDRVCQCYRETYAYVAGPGWLHPTDPNPDGPLIEPGTGFFVQKLGPTRAWAQTFTVN